MNVRAFAFRPNTDPAVITGLVTWDGLDFADSYEVTVMEGGMQLPNVSANYMYTLTTPTHPHPLPIPTHPHPLICTH
jgi:hypothetical protein